MRTWMKALVVMVVTVSGAGLSALSAAPASGTAGIGTINHIVVLMQENRSADTYFGQLNSQGQPAYEAEPTTGNPNPLVSGGTIVPFHKVSLCETADLNHSWNGEHQALHSGAMDGFTAANDILSANADTTDPTGSRTMGYYNQTDLPFYYSLYNTFATNDRYFASVLSQTYPNRFYALAGTSFGHIRNDSPPPGGWTQQTIFDRLGAANISWKIYYSQFPFGSFFSYVQQHMDHVAPISQYYADAAAGTLPSVSFVDPTFIAAPNTETDEHPSSNVQVGQNFSYGVYQALRNGPNWPDSAMFLTYDENGGFYDHVAPPSAVAPDAIAPMLQPGDTSASFNQYGIRVPVVVMSPYAKPHYVSHVVDDHTSILRFIETRYGLPSLTARDAAADPMLGMFDFSTPALLNAPAFAAPPVTPCTAPTISLHPNSQTVHAGQTVTFTAAASTETAPSVQWQLSVDHGSTWFNVAGLTSPSFSGTVTPFVNGWEVRAVFTNPIGSATTNAATLTVISAPPVITLQPVSQTAKSGQTVTFSSAATGTPSPTVQWQLSVDHGSTWSDVAGLTSPSFSGTVIPFVNGWEVRAVFTNAVGSATSNAATITVT
jgi:phospholipase C